MLKPIFLFLISIACITQAIAQVPMGRMAYIADGNYRDSDDIAATPVGLAILRAMGLEKKLVHYSHSCDLKPGSGDPGGPFREKEMQISSDGTAERWGGFEHITFFNALRATDATVNDLVKHINNSTEADPLWIIEAGEPDIMVMALKKSDRAKAKFVHIITHHPANDKGDTYNLEDVFKEGVPTANIHRIPDQNTLLRKKLSEFHWARDHKDSRIKWLWDRVNLAQSTEMKYPQIVGWADISDAGMVWWWATLDKGGDEKCDFPKIRKLLEDYVAKPVMSISFSGNPRGLEVHSGKGGFTIVASSEPIQLEVVNLQGKVIHHESGRLKSTFIPVTEKGMHFIRLSQGNFRINTKYVSR